MSVDTFVSIVDTMLQAVAVGLMIMTALYQQSYYATFMVK